MSRESESEAQPIHIFLWWFVWLSFPWLFGSLHAWEWKRWCGWACGDDDCGPKDLTVLSAMSLSGFCKSVGTTVQYFNPMISRS